MNKIFTSITAADSKKHTDEFSFLLKPSQIAGVGVFAAHDIKAGTRLNMFDGKIRYITLNKLNKDKYKRLKEFTDFFGVVDGKKVLMPDNFSSMSVGWYLNHSDDFNAIHDANYRYFAHRDIAAGQEITIDYNEL